MESGQEALLHSIEARNAEKLREILALENATEGWEDLGVADDVESSRLYVPETGYYIIKGVGDIEKPIADIYAVIIDIPNKGKWDQLFVEGREVERLSETVRLNYQHFSAPWPVSHRDFAFASVTNNLEDGGIASVAFSVETPLVPEVSGLVRGEIHIAGFVLRKITDDLTHVTYLIHIDPRGSIPTMVINQTQKKQTQNVSKIRAYLSRS